MKIKFVKVIDSEFRRNAGLPNEIFVSGTDEYGKVARTYMEGNVPKYVLRFIESHEEELWDDLSTEDTNNFIYIYR